MEPDHDGDVLGLNVMMSDEANEEDADYLNAPISMVDANGGLVYGLADNPIIKFSMYSTSYHVLPEQ